MIEEDNPLDMLCKAALSRIGWNRVPLNTVYISDVNTALEKFNDFNSKFSKEVFFCYTLLSTVVPESAFFIRLGNVNLCFDFKCYIKQRQKTITYELINKFKMFLRNPNITKITYDILKIRALDIIVGLDAIFEGIIDLKCIIQILRKKECLSLSEDIQILECKIVDLCNKKKIERESNEKYGSDITHAIVLKLVTMGDLIRKIEVEYDALSIQEVKYEMTSNILHLNTIENVKMKETQSKEKSHTDVDIIVFDSD
jgi:hypothetical protein